jgi:hypothetical protein
MIAPETRVVVKVPSCEEVMEEVRLEVLRLVGEKVVEFQEEQFITWFGKPWQREKDAKGMLQCQKIHAQQCSGSPELCTCCYSTPSQEA